MQKVSQAKKPNKGRTLKEQESIWSWMHLLLKPSSHFPTGPGVLDSLPDRIATAA